MSAGRGRGRGRGRGSSKPPDAIANTAKELGLNPLAFNFGKVRVNRVQVLKYLTAVGGGSAAYISRNKVASVWMG